MWTDGIEALVKARKFSSPREWLTYINDAADMAMKFRGNLPKKVPERTQERRDDASQFEADAEALMGWIGNGSDLDHGRRAQLNAAEYIRRCLASSGQSSTATKQA